MKKIRVVTVLVFQRQEALDKNAILKANLVISRKFRGDLS
jgi:hypothetical protein